MEGPEALPSTSYDIVKLEIVVMSSAERAGTRLEEEVAAAVEAANAFGAAAAAEDDANEEGKEEEDAEVRGNASDFRASATAI